MNVLVGLLLRVAAADDVLPEEVEEQVFTVLISVLEVYGLSGLFEPGQPLLTDLLEVSDQLILQTEPEIWQHFKDQSIDLAVYVYPWYQFLFIDWLPLPLVFAIWDCVFCEGVAELVRCAIALVRLLKETLLCMGTDELV